MGLLPSPRPRTKGFYQPRIQRGGQGEDQNLLAKPLIWPGYLGVTESGCCPNSVIGQTEEIPPEALFKAWDPAVNCAKGLLLGASFLMEAITLKFLTHGSWAREALVLGCLWEKSERKQRPSMHLPLKC